MALILIADDSKIICDIYRNMLDMMGHTPLICSNGLEALEAFKDEVPDLALLDVDVPLMNGIDVCKEIRKLPSGKNVPIIIAYSSNNENDVLRGLDAGADDYLIKPVQSVLLAVKIKKLLEFSILYKEDCKLAEKHALVADRYLIEKVIGYGPHSIVFLAQDSERANENVALKLLKYDLAQRDIMKLFINIARRCMNADCENLVHIYDTGLKDDRIYVAMQYESEGSLCAKIRFRSLLDWEACKLGLDIVRALAVLKKQGVLHLNVKPENIMISNSEYKLTDFGIVIPRTSKDIPIGKELWNKLEYVCPEYLTGEYDLSARSDVYSLGVILYEAVTNNNPFIASKPMASIAKQSNYIPAPLYKLNDTISIKFSKTLVAMLDKNPEKRPRLLELEQIFSKLYEELKHSSKHKIKTIKKSSRVKLPNLKSEQDSAGKKIVKEFESFMQPASISKRSFKEKLSIYKTPILIIAIVVIFSWVVYINGLADGIFSSSDVSKPTVKESLKIVRCEDGHNSKVRFTSIDQARCQRCGKTAGIAYQCMRCKHKFPAPPAAKNITKKLKSAFEKNRYKCPKCKSAKTKSEAIAVDNVEIQGNK